MISLERSYVTVKAVLTTIWKKNKTKKHWFSKIIKCIHIKEKPFRKASKSFLLMQKNNYNKAAQNHIKSLTEHNSIERKHKWVKKTNKVKKYKKITHQALLIA